MKRGVDRSGRPVHRGGDGLEPGASARDPSGPCRRPIQTSDTAGYRALLRVLLAQGVGLAQRELSYRSSVKTLVGSSVAPGLDGRNSPAAPSNTRRRRPARFSTPGGHGWSSSTTISAAKARDWSARLASSIAGDAVAGSGMLPGVTWPPDRRAVPPPFEGDPLLAADGATVALAYPFGSGGRDPTPALFSNADLAHAGKRAFACDLLGGRSRAFDERPHNRAVGQASGTLPEPALGVLDLVRDRRHTVG